MARGEKKNAEERTKTEYVVLRKYDPGAASEPVGELYELFPGTHTGSPIRALAADNGGGDYVQVPVSSFKPKPVTIDTSPRVKIG